MSIAAEKLPLPHRDVRNKSYRDATAYKKILPRRCGDGFQKNVSSVTAATVWDQKYWY
jgi:hypothetical protein